MKVIHVCVTEIWCKHFRDEQEKPSMTVFREKKNNTSNHRHERCVKNDSEKKKTNLLLVCKVCCIQFRDEEDESHSM